MNTPDDPLLRAILQDEAWQAACKETQHQAARTLRRRRCWRTLRHPLALAMFIFCVWEGSHWATEPESHALVQQSIQSTALPSRKDLQFDFSSSFYLAPYAPLPPDLSLQFSAFKPQYETSLLYESPLLSESPILLYKPFYE